MDEFRIKSSILWTLVCLTSTAKLLYIKHWLWDDTLGNLNFLTYNITTVLLDTQASHLPDLVCLCK